MQFLTVLAGANFRTSADRGALAQAYAGLSCFLVREPDNQYDSNAVKVILPYDNVEHFIGYVARADNYDIARLLDAASGNEDARSSAESDKLIAAGHTPVVTRCEIIDFASGTLKPTIVIEISDGWEVGTVVQGPDEDGNGEGDYFPEEDEDE